MLTLRSRVAEGAGGQSGRRRRLPTKARKKPPRNPIMKHSGMPQSNRSPNIKSMASLTAMHIRSIAILLERRVNIRPEANAPMPDTAIITYIIQFSILYQQPPQQIYPDRPDKKRVKLNGFDFRGLKQKRQNNAQYTSPLNNTLNIKYLQTNFLENKNSKNKKFPKISGENFCKSDNLLNFVINLVSLDLDATDHTSD